MNGPGAFPQIIPDRTDFNHLPTKILSRKQELDAAKIVLASSQNEIQLREDLPKMLIKFVMEGITFDESAGDVLDDFKKIEKNEKVINAYELYILPIAEALLQYVTDPTDEGEKVLKDGEETGMKVKRRKNDIFLFNCTENPGGPAFERIIYPLIWDYAESIFEKPPYLIPRFQQCAELPMFPRPPEDITTNRQLNAIDDGLKHLNQAMIVLRDLGKEDPYNKLFTVREIRNSSYIDKMLLTLQKAINSRSNSPFSKELTDGLESRSELLHQHENWLDLWDFHLRLLELECHFLQMKYR